MTTISLPRSSDEDYLALEKDKRRPLINYAIGGLYPARLHVQDDHGLGRAGRRCDHAGYKDVDAGPIFLMNHYFPNDSSQAQKFVSWNHKLGIVHGAMNVVQALALSNDIFFYYMGGGFPDQFEGLGQKRLSKWMELFGYGEPTGIDLPGEVAAQVPTDQWKRQLFAETWTTGDSYNMAIGQGYVLATPLQVLLETATVANGGTVYEPRVVHHMTDANGGVQKDFTPMERTRSCRISARRHGIRTPRHVVSRQRRLWYGGGGAGARGTVAGKTGTAEFCEYVPEKNDCRRDEKDNLPTHAWFTAFAPYDNPEIAVVVFVYNGGEGSGTCRPVAQKILQTYFTEIAPAPRSGRITRE